MPAGSATIQDDLYSRVKELEARLARVEKLKIQQVGEKSWDLVRDFGADPTGVVPWDTAISLAITQLNVENNQRLRIPAGTYKATVLPPPILTSNIVIEGDGISATTVQIDSVGSLGTIWTVGADDVAGAARAVTISGIAYQQISTPGASANIFNLINADDFVCDNTRCIGVAGLVQVGGTGTYTVSSRVRFSNVYGTYDASVGGKVVRIQQGASLRFENVHLGGSGTPSSTTRSVLCDSQNNVDGVYFQNCHIWAPEAGGQFQQIGALFDFTSGQIVNVWITDSVFDHTGSEGIYIVSTGGTSICRGINVRGTRATPDAGYAVRINHNGTGLCELINFSDKCIFDFTEVEAVNIGGTGPKANIRFNNVDFRKIGVTAVQAAVVVGANTDDCGVDNCHLKGASPSAYFVRFTATDVLSYSVQNNKGAPSTGFVQHPAYAADSDRRIVDGNTTATQNRPVALNGVKLLTKAGAIVDGDFSGGAPSGLLGGVDTTNNVLYFKSGGAWYTSGGVNYATPAIALGTAAAAGSAATVIRSDSTIVAFDATNPTTQALGDTPVVGSAAVAARRDHKHGMPSAGVPVISRAGHALNLTGSGPQVSYNDHRHAREWVDNVLVAVGTGTATGSTNLQLRTLVGGEMSSSGVLEIWAHGKFKGTLGTRTARLSWAGAFIISYAYPAGNAAADWAMHALIYNDAATNAQQCVVWMWVAATPSAPTLVYFDVVTASADTSVNQNIRTNGIATNGTVADEVLSEVLFCQHIKD